MDRRDEDRIGQFLDEACLIGATYRDADGRPFETPASIVYASYARWCEAQGEKPVSKKKLGGVLTEKSEELGFARRHCSGVRYGGLTIRAEWLVAKQ